MKKFTKFAVRSVSAAAIAAFGLAQAPVAAAQDTTLRLHNFNSPKALANEAFIGPWIKEIAEKTGGKLKIQNYPAMQLGGKPGDLYSQARDGVVDIIWTLPGYSPGRFPLTEVFELPYVAGDAVATSQAMTEFAGKWLTEEYGDTRPLVFHTTARGHIHTSKKAIRTVEDIKGMKVRGHSRINTDTLRTLGAVPVGMPVPDVYEAMSRGVVEGTWIPWTIMRPFRIHEVTKFHTELSISPALFAMVMNKQSYEKLTADMKQAIDDTTGVPLAKKLGILWEEDEKPGREMALKMGHEIVTLSEAEEARWRAALEPAVDEWIEKTSKTGVDARAMVEDARRLVAKYSN